MFQITPSSRLRRSPYFDATVAAGVTGFTTYNRMLLPTGYGDAEAEYWRLIHQCSLWDVAAERQIQLQGPDAAVLASILCPRDLSTLSIGQGKYVAVCNHHGVLLNDPILLKMDEQTFWLSIADSDIEFWASAIAAERKLRVDVSEVDASPLAIQGPKAASVVAALFGDWVRDIRPFRFRHAVLDGIPLLVARSGWSKQGGYELYLLDNTRGTDLWNRVAEAGKPFDIGPGNPNACERIESGLLSWGGDTDKYTNPFEVRMDGFVDVDVADDVVGIAALRAFKERGVQRHQLGVVLDADKPLPVPASWSIISLGGQACGHMTNGVWSWRLERNIGFGLVSRAATVGDRVKVVYGDKPFDGELTELPFI